MDLAQSILKELITLQSKNEELARIITKLEHESDIIIQQFEKKIEELQNTVKHELDEKSRAARRYEAEIRELEETKDALINEVNGVRETYQMRITQIEEKVQSLISVLETREKEYEVLAGEKEKLTTVYDQTLSSLQSRLEEQEETARNEQDTLNSQARALADTLKRDRDHYTVQIQQKDTELHRAREALQSLDQRLREYANRENVLEEQSRQTIEHLHHLINTERQIRTRELKERDVQVKSLEDELTSVRQGIKDLETRSQEEIYEGKRESSRLQGLLSDALLTQARFEEEKHNLSHLLATQEEEHKKTLTELREKLEGEKSTFENQVRVLHEEIQSSTRDHTEAIRARDEENASLSHRVKELEETLLSESKAKQEFFAELTSQKTSLEAEKARLDGMISSAESEKSRLQETIKESEEKYEHEIARLQGEITLGQGRLVEVERYHQREINRINDELKEVTSERDRLSSERQAREDYYRNEITGLHQEISAIQDSLKVREDDLLKEISGRDRQIQELFTNNEVLRVEIDRVRHQYHKLQETIRAEKDESVHALYREITALEEAVTGRDREILSLSEKILRLDAENTRLIQQGTPEVQSVSGPPPPVQVPGKVIATTSGENADINDPGKKEVLALATDLEDPARAAEAAEKLAAMGHAIVDLLIPLLHTGSIQRRVWIAVVLYEINDNRATLPLMKLLETPKVHFRELIWEAKNQYHTRMRMGLTPAEPVVKAGLYGPGRF